MADMSNIQESYDYVIVGGGVAAASAVKGIRSEDRSGTIAVLGSEPDKPVYRPALSKDLWLKDDATLEGNSLAGDLDDDDAVDLVTDTTVTAIDPDAHVVRLADGSSVGYGKLLLATGAEPRTLAVDPGPRVVYYRTAADYERLRAIVDAGQPRGGRRRWLHRLRDRLRARAERRRRHAGPRPRGRAGADVPARARGQPHPGLRRPRRHRRARLGRQRRGHRRAA